MATTKVKIYDIIALLFIVFAAANTMNESLLSTALFIAIPISFICCALHYNTMQNNEYIRILAALYIWLCICYPFSIYIEPASIEMRRVLGCFILAYSFASLASKAKLVPLLYCIYCILLACAWKYADANIINDITFGENRLGDDKLNANHMAYYTFYATISIYILGEIISNAKLKTLFKLLFFGTIILSFITAIFTASRQVLYIQIPLFITLFAHRYLIQNKQSLLLKLSIIIACITLFTYLFAKYGEDIYSSSLLKERSATSFTDDERYAITKEAINLGLERPLIGYGPGNAMHHTSNRVFTHNTFLELFVNSGLPGVIIFAYLILVFLKKQYTRWIKTKDKFFLLFIIFGLFWIIYQTLYVFYVDLWLISFFLLASTHSNSYYYNKYTILK